MRELCVTSAAMARRAQQRSPCLVVGRAVRFAPHRATAWAALSPAAESSCDLYLPSPRSMTALMLQQKLEYCIIM